MLGKRLHTDSSSAITAAYIFAGTALGLTEGCWRALARTRQRTESGAVQGSRELCTPPPASCRPPATSKPLLNIVLVEQGVGKTPAVSSYLGRKQASTPLPDVHDDCELELVDTVVDGCPATLAVWCMGRDDTAADLGLEFFCLASSFVIMYSPLSSPLATLEYWEGVRHSGGGAAQPAVVVACCQVPDDCRRQQAHLEAGRKWCAEHGSIPHITMCTPGDLQPVMLAFAEAGRLALCHIRHTNHQVRHSPSGAVSALQQKTGSPCSGLPIKLPNLMQAELGSVQEVLTHGRQ